MNGAQAVDMSYTPSNVVHMSKMIQIRNVPDELHLALKARALAEGMSLSDYIKRELSQSSGKMTLEEIDARIQARGPSKVRTKWVLETLRESRGD
jgi:antitoxin FitA